jgi:pantoate kinase
MLGNICQWSVHTNDVLLRLANKVPPELERLTENPQTRRFFERAQHIASPEVIPEEVVERIKATQENRLAHFIEDLREVSHVLSSNVPLEKEILEILDEICDAADALASTAFCRLQRR